MSHGPELEAAAEELAQCRHTSARELREGVTWCTSCGALRFTAGGWLMPARLLHLVALLEGASPWLEETA